MLPSALWAAVEVGANDPRLSRHADQLLLDGRPFTGRVVSYYSNRRKEFDHEYQGGRKVGQHKAWYDDGQMRSLAEYSGPNALKRRREWYKSGQIYSDTEYKNGVEVAAKIWRATGQIYSNTVIKNGRSYGLRGSKACVRLKEEDAVR